MFLPSLVTSEPNAISPTVHLLGILARSRHPQTTNCHDPGALGRRNSLAEQRASREARNAHRLIPITQRWHVCSRTCRGKEPSAAPHQRVMMSHAVMSHAPPSIRAASKAQRPAADRTLLDRDRPNRTDPNRTADRSRYKRSRPDDTPPKSSANLNLQSSVSLFSAS